MSQEYSLTVQRTLNATLERVWHACSDANALRAWWGQPQGATMPAIELDFRVGGFLHFKVELPQGEVIWGKTLYKEIVPPDPATPLGQAKIVMEDHYSNEKGEFLDSSEWPPSTITLTLEDTPEGTKLTIVHEGIGEGAHKVEQYKEGWAQSLERLAMDLINQ